MELFLLSRKTAFLGLTTYEMNFDMLSKHLPFKENDSISASTYTLYLLVKQSVNAGYPSLRTVKLVVKCVIDSFSVFIMLV